MVERPQVPVSIANRHIQGSLRMEKRSVAPAKSGNAPS
jgi:hypothetical protein